MRTCDCNERHDRRRIVLTGGPGAGKTAVLELIRQSFCAHVKVLPESAGIIFGGGFPRGEAIEFRESAQRAIFYVQRELENMADTENPAIVLCDRGTVDGAAYWPGGVGEFFSSLGTDLDKQIGRYHTTQSFIFERRPWMGGTIVAILCGLRQPSRRRQLTR